MRFILGLIVQGLLLTSGLFAQSLPLIINDESYSNWVVDCFAGNSTAGNVFYQGPRLEIGGLQTPAIPLVLSNGTAYMLDGNGTGLMEISPQGSVRLLMGSYGNIEGPIETCVYGQPFWNPKDTALYISGPNCLRKIVTHENGSQWVEVVAGIPNSAGTVDGPAKSAKFPLRCLGLVCDSQGVFYWLQDDGKRPGGKLRRIKNDTVTTLPLIFDDTTEGFNWAMGEGNLALGENSNTLYISDFYNFRILKYDIPTGHLTLACGVPDSADIYSRRGQNADGPALTHVSANSGLRCKYDPFHRNLWVRGPDENRFRWLRLSDGWVKTVMGPGSSGWNVDGLNIAGSAIQLNWNNESGFDDRGGVYISGNPTTNVYRAYNKTEVK